MRKVLIAALAVLFVFVSGCGKTSKQTKLFNEKDFIGWTMYLADKDIDPNMVWMVKDGVMHCKGNPAGYIRTNDDFSDYKLHLEWRWVKEGGNSGVLVHSQAPDVLWPKSIECQLFSQNAGDFWLIGGVGITINGEVKQSPNQAIHVAKKNESNEKLLGEWNSYDIYCEGDAVRCFVNGVLQNEGSKASVSSGKICLQSEGAAIEFRNIYIEGLKK